MQSIKLEILKVAEKIFKVSILEEVEHKLLDVLSKHVFELRFAIFWHLSSEHMLNKNSSIKYFIEKNDSFVKTNLKHTVEGNVDVDLRILVDLQICYNIIFYWLVVDKELVLAN